MGNLPLICYLTTLRDALASLRKKHSFRFPLLRIDTLSWKKTFMATLHDSDNTLLALVRT